MYDSDYQELAPAYDLLQQGIKPAAWSDYIQALEIRFSRRRGPGDGRDGRTLLLDLGCGTGGLCLEMLRRGYDVIGIDQSPAMLDQARRKSGRFLADSGEDLPEPLFLQQDISRFELYGTADLIVCLLDTVNHLIRPGAVARLFRLCANYLNPGGLLIFDLATLRHLSRTLGQRQIFQDTDKYTLFWQNHYRPAGGISRAELILFSRRPDGSYGRLDMTISEKYYRSDQVRRWISFAGLDWLGSSAGLGKDAGSPPAPAPVSERRFFIARKPGGTTAITGCAENPDQSSGLSAQSGSDIAAYETA